MAKAKLLASVLVLAVPFLAQRAAAQCTGLAHETATTSCPDACTDGISNDLDGLVDRLDPDCQHESVTTWYAAACSDGIDQDGDGYIDRLAYGVGGSLGADPNCLIETNWGPYNACSDGINNDGDRYDNTTAGTTWTELIDRIAPLGATPDPECLGEVLCTDLVDNDGDGLTDVLDKDCQCLGPATNLDNCTANDFTIAFTANPQEVADGCINSTDQVTLTSLRASLTAHSPDRYDLGLWIALDGTSAYDGGRCLRQALTPVKKNILASDPGYPSGPYGPIDYSGAEPSGWYPTLETVTPQNNTDQCGEVGNSQTAVWQYPVPVTVPCNDLVTVPSAGFVDLGQCGSWDNNQTNSYCGSVTQAIPNTKAKCQCQTADTNVPAPDVHASCDNFTTPTWLSGQGSTLDPGETVRFQLSFTNEVEGCSPATLPINDDPFGRTRCGTVSFMRFVVDYNLGGNDADAYGTFYLDDGTTEIPVCPATASVSQSPLAGAGVVCNNTASKRLVWAPRDPISSSGSYYPAYGVLSPFTGSIALPFRYQLAAAPPSGNVGLAATILWDATLDADGLNGISAAEAVTVTQFSKLQTSCVDCTCATGFTTTPVTLASFAASREGSRAVFDWTTATEAGNVGFNLLGETAEGWVRLNPDLLPAEGGDTLEPRRYTAVLSVPDDVVTFAIEDVDLRGKARRHAAADLATSEGGDLEPEPIPSERIRREHELGEALRHDERRDRAAAAIRAASAASPFSVKTAAAGKSNPVIELRVDRDGLYRVTYEDLAAAGFDLAAVQSAKLGLRNRGAAVPIHVGAGRTFGPGSWFDFHGRALDTLYTTTNVYRLEVDAVKPARAAVDAAAPSGSAAPFYMATRDFERDREYSFSSPTGDPWYDTRMLVYGAPGEWRFPFAVDGLLDGAAPASLHVRLFGGTDTQQAPDHRAVVSLNGVALGEAAFDGLVDVPLTFELPAGLLREGENTLSVALPADTGAQVDIVHLESWSVTYPRAFAATDGSLTFASAADRFTVTGLPGGQVAAYRVSGTALTALAGTATTDGGATAEVRGGAAGTYLVAAAGALPAPEIGAARPAARITGERAQYLAIAHPDFIDGLAPLVAARQAQGLQVRVVDVEDVYSQFGHGIFDPEAIRAYVAHAAATMGTEYLLLVGGDTYDYRDTLGAGSVSFIPSLYTATGDIVLYAPTDPAYADVDRDGVPDLAIGRLPVRTRGELDTLIAKILAYQAKDYGGTAVLAADRSDAAANLPFAAASERLAAALTGGWTARRAYLDQLSVAEARAVLLTALDGGVALANYVGHSGATAWTSKGLFTAADAAALTNAGRPAVVTQWGCWNSYYVNPRTESLATRLLLAGDRGAAAVLGAATLTEDVDENDLGVLLAERIAQPGATLGKAVLAAKRALQGDRAARADVLLGWVLLGDPALVVRP